MTFHWSATDTPPPAMLFDGMSNVLLINCMHLEVWSTDYDAVANRVRRLPAKVGPSEALLLPGAIRHTAFVSL